MIDKNKPIDEMSIDELNDIIYRTEQRIKELKSENRALNETKKIIDEKLKANNELAKVLEEQINNKNKK